MNDYENINKIIFQNIVLRRIREVFKIIIAMIFSNIAFILFQESYIAHFRFKIPLNITIQFFYDVINEFNLIELLYVIELIF